MKPFDVYPLFQIEPVKGEGCYVWDKNGRRYLDLYGGHAVISIGHSHPHFVEKVSGQLGRLAFYSNSILNPLQDELGEKLGNLSGYPDYQLFMCNSGAEANENALKLASFFTNRKKVISFSKGFHGRTSLAVAVTDNPKIVAPANQTEHAHILPLNDSEVLAETFQKVGDQVAAVIIEGIQGVGGINLPTTAFMQQIRQLCDQYGALLVADSVQCGYGRSGKFFAHDHFGVQADIYSMAKGMGNGFPIGSIAIHPRIKPVSGQLGTTFGGNHLACAAAIAVLDVLKDEQLIRNAEVLGTELMHDLQGLPHVREVRGKGLMIGIELDQPAADLRKKLLFEHGIFTGSASNPNVVRLLPPLCLSKDQAHTFLEKFTLELKKW